MAKGKQKGVVPLEVADVQSMADKMSLSQLKKLQKQAQMVACQVKYSEYVEYVHRPENGGRERWRHSKHLDFICDRIQEHIETQTGNAFDILTLQLPPQHGKSMTITETLPSWYLGKYPNRRVILVSYNTDFAADFCRRNKEKILAVGKPLFGINIGGVNTQTDMEIDKHAGGMISRGVMSGITGKPGDLIIIDDPVKNRQEADSETYRDAVWKEWLNSIRTRLSAGAKVIVIMTRWHEDDLAGRIIANEKHVTVINLPCEAEGDDPLGRQPGDSLFPEIGKDKAWLEDFKYGYQSAEGSRAWNALYQGHPVADEGNMIKREWWKYYDEPPEMMQIIMSVDAAFKDNDNSDYVAIQAWGKREADMYLLDSVNEHLDFPGTLRAIMSMRSRWPSCRIVLIEDKANGSAAIQMLRRKITGVIPVNPQGGKVARLNAVSPAIESGNVWLPRKKSFTTGFVDQFSAFPNGKNDDMVDCCTQALNRFIYHSAGVPTFHKRDAFEIYTHEPSMFTDDIPKSWINYGIG